LRTVRRQFRGARLHSGRTTRSRSQRRSCA
jgi:hypothetical protein